MPLAERLATTPSFVEGTYAPPVNVYSHFLHFQTPTLTRFTLTKPHCGHRWAFLSPAIALMYRFLTVDPYRAPRPRVEPTFFVLPKFSPLHLFTQFCSFVFC